MNDHSVSTSEERSALLNGLADGSLVPSQEQRLADLLRMDAEFRREYVRFCQLQTQLTWAAAVLNEAGATPAMLADNIPAPRSHRQMSRGRLLTGSTLVLIGAVAMAIGIVWTTSRPLRNVPMAVIANVKGRVQVLRDGMPPITLSAADLSQFGWPLEPEDRLQSQGVASATIVLADQTRLTIDPNTILSLGKKQDHRVILSRGRIMAEVMPQSADRPLTFITPEATVRVLGTSLELLAVAERTDVAVTKGKVRVTRTVDDAAVEVGAAQFVAVASTGSLMVVDWPLAPDVWGEDFEYGLPAGWSGRMVREGLPNGSRGGLEAVAPSGSRGRFAEIASPLRTGGLFAWHADTVLHLTFRVPPPAWFHMSLSVRTYGRPEPWRAWCRVDPDLWQTNPGAWRTVSIPLSEFQFSGFEHPVEELGRIPLQLIISGPADLPGVVIDSVRVDRGGRLTMERSLTK